MGITWRLGFGATKDHPPEEWQDHPATINLPLTAELYVHRFLLGFKVDVLYRATNPPAIWTAAAARVFS